ncbi:bromodomain-containing protein [Gossypium australe]|uniref:Bromodomain-containing protein n=1 Tax=Gossypium australe TaxID=47621 RepID=A0A5B6VNM3_9ROSI|nr:bromodomain-containing protein [Gossypium australe]
MIAAIKRQIGTEILINTENNPRIEGKKHVKVIALRWVKSLNINLPLIDLIEKVPKYSKYLKEIRSSVIVSKPITPKLKDPRSFTKPIEIGDIHFSKALCDLGANINLMPLLIYEKLRCLLQPKEVLEDALAKVRSFIILIDFVILDIEEGCAIHILLGRPFLATSKSTIDLEKLTLSINGNT